MANVYNTTVVLGSLGTTTIGGNGPGVYLLKGSITLPRQSEGTATASQLVVTVSINGGSAIYTGIAGADSFATGATLSATDVFTITLSSTATIDQIPNSIKASITLTGAF